MGASAAAGLQVDRVSVQFGGLHALSDVSLAAGPGQIVGVIGPNGAGKTTLFNVISGFVHPTSGSVSWEGQPITGLTPHQRARRGIARTVQGLGLFAHLTVLDNVMVGADGHARAGIWSSLLALPRADRDEAALRERAREQLARLGIGDVAGRLATTLPYGIQKRVAIARALVADPRLLLLDEPASGLSAADMAELGELITTVGRDTAVVLVEHHMDLVMSVCDTVVVLDFGKLIASGSPDEVRDDPAVINAYLGESADFESADHGSADPADDPLGRSAHAAD